MANVTAQPRTVIIQGDCGVQLAKIDDESVDLIFTSPPYANQRASSYGGVKPDAYAEWFRPIAAELKRVLKPTGTFVLNIKEPAVDGQRHTLAMDIIRDMIKDDWLWTEEFIWHKKNSYPGKWPNRFRDSWERLLQFNKQRKFKMNQEAVMVPVGDWYDSRMRSLSETDRVRDESRVSSGFGKKVENWLGREMVYPSNVLYGATECSNRNHSAVFPYWLPEWFIKLFTDPGDVVLDPFVGSGTTALVALENNREAISIEKYPPYYYDLKLRLQNDFEVHDMTTITDQQVIAYVEQNIGTFHEKRLEALQDLKLDDLLLRKNPYLFKSKNITTAAELVKVLLDAHLSSQEETLFGRFLERLAVFASGITHNGGPSTAEGVDLEFSKGSTKYIVSIKSGPKWGNSSQIKKMKDNFAAASQRLHQIDPNLMVVAVNGCCYGREETSHKGTYFKYCGQKFWELVSDDRDFYTRIIEPLGHRAKQRNAEFQRSYGAVQNRFTEEFIQRFCDEDRNIDWDRLVRFSSSTTPPLALPADTRLVNRLPNVISVCDVLSQWGYHQTAQDITAMATGIPLDMEAGMNRASPQLAASLRGLLKLLGTAESDGQINVSITEDDLIQSEWTFLDDRSVEITLLDNDRISVVATNAAGKPVKLRNSKRTTRTTAVNRLVEQGLFRMIDN